ncbi:MAG: cation:proton antiporter subunit C [Bacillota bacterium]
MEFLKSLSNNYYYLVAIILFVIGMHTMLTHANLIKKVIAMNIMDASVFLLFVAVGYVRGGAAPVIEASANRVYVNPLPGALMLTGIVVGISVTAYALSLVTKIFRYYGTVDADEIVEIRSQEQ